MKLDSWNLRRVAVAAGCDPTTVARYLAGRPGKPAVTRRVEAGLRACGLEHLVRSGGDETATDDHMPEP